MNKLDYALKRRYIIEGLSDTEKTVLKDLLIEHNPQWWERSPEELKEKLV